MSTIPWGTQTVTRRQFAVGTYVAGAWVQGAATDTTLTDCRWVPAPEKALEHLDAGDRSREARLLFTQSELRTAKAGGYSSDAVSFDDGTTWYEVQSVKDFSAAPFRAHYEGLVLAVKEAE